MIIKLWIPKTFIGWFYVIFRWKAFLLYKDEVEWELRRERRVSKSLLERNMIHMNDKKELQAKIYELNTELCKYK